jgi:hypothetical protein
MVRRRHLTKFGVLPDVASRPQADSCTAQILSHSITSSARLSSVGTMPSCFCRLEIYYQLALGRLHNRKFRGLFAHPTDIDTCLPSCVRQIGTVADKATKLVLDFLQRPATMASRQHSGTKLFHKTGKTRSATATPLLRGRVPIWRYGSCAGCNACLANNSPCFTPKSPPPPEAWKH